MAGNLTAHSAAIAEGRRGNLFIWKRQTRGTLADLRKPVRETENRGGREGREIGRAVMGTREVYEEKLRSGNLFHDPTINPGLGSARCPRCLSLINPNSVSAILRFPALVLSVSLCFRMKSPFDYFLFHLNRVYINVNWGCEAGAETAWPV